MRIAVLFYIVIGILTSCQEQEAKTPTRQTTTAKGETAKDSEDKTKTSDPTTDDSSTQKNDNIPLPNNGNSGTPSNCDQNGVTRAKTLTPQYTITGGSVMVFELTLVDCNGNPQSLEGRTIYFDIEGQVEKNNASSKEPSYELGDPNGSAPSMEGFFWPRTGTAGGNPINMDGFRYYVEKIKTGGATTLHLTVAYNETSKYLFLSRQDKSATTFKLPIYINFDNSQMQPVEIEFSR